MSNILVIGSLNADLVVRAQRFPQPGETISGEDLQDIPGGKGANQAVAAARLGSNVSMLGRVGKDNFGDFLLENLKSNQVDSKFVQRDDASTGTAIIVVDSNGQNNIVLSPGANGKVSTADVEKNTPTRGRVSKPEKIGEGGLTAQYIETHIEKKQEDACCTKAVKQCSPRIDMFIRRGFSFQIIEGKKQAGKQAKDNSGRVQSPHRWVMCS